MTKSDVIEFLIKKRINSMGISTDDVIISQIRSKSGVHVYKVISEGISYVMKYFENVENAREIKNCDILKSLKIPMLKKYGTTSDSILIEHIDSIENFRLGTEDDLKNPEVSKAIARWYEKLHSSGRHYAGLSQLYCEYDILTMKNLNMVMDKSDSRENPLWGLIMNRFKQFVDLINKQKYTLTYNDFFWTNLAVSSDCKSALMFDFNLLGRGYAYADIRNVCSVLSGEAASAFMNEYGPYEEKEKVVDEAIADLHSLIEAFHRDSFPSWADSSLNNLKSGRISEKMHIALDMYGS